MIRESDSGSIKLERPNWNPIKRMYPLENGLLCLKHPVVSFFDGAYTAHKITFCVGIGFSGWTGGIGTNSTLTSSDLSQELDLHKEPIFFIKSVENLSTMFG